MRTPFEIKGEVAEWRMLYEALAAMEINETISYAQIDEILGRTFDESRGPLYRAEQELQEKNHRALSNVRGVGYRIVPAKEHEGLARGRQRRARRQVTKGLRVLRSADREQLTPQEVARFDDLEARFSRLEQHFNSLSHRQRKTDERLEKTERQQEDVVAQVEKLTQTLRDRGLLDD